MIRTPSAASAALVPAILAFAAVVTAAPAAAQSSRAAGLAQLRAEFQATDINRDGVLTKPEVAARIDHMKMAGATRSLSPAQARELTNLWFARTDANHDGRVTLDEAEGEFTRLFDRYDLNHDGVISPAERSAARAQMKAQGAVPNGR